MPIVHHLLTANGVTAVDRLSTIVDITAITVELSAQNDYKLIEQSSTYVLSSCNFGDV
jgi:hypothetical protein